MNLVLHASTNQSVNEYAANPPHSVLITGADGSGKGTIAKLLVSQVLACALEALAQYPSVATIEPVKASISIDAIRELQRFVQLKTVGTATIRRAIIIEHADTLTIEAQNAFLKLLEEPPADTVIVLTAQSKRALLATILSRVQLISLTPPSESAVRDHFAQTGKDDKLITQAYFLSGGLPGLMHALLAQDEPHPLLQAVDQAKDILGQSTFERLCLVDGLAKQKETAAYVLEALTRIAQTGIARATNGQDRAKLQQWHHILEVTHEALQALKQSANAKLVLSNAMLQM